VGGWPPLQGPSWLAAPARTKLTVAAGVIVSVTSTALIQDNYIPGMDGLNGTDGTPNSGEDGISGGLAVDIYALGAAPRIIGNQIEGGCGPGMAAPAAAERRALTARLPVKTAPQAGQAATEGTAGQPGAFV